jgi:hypothetical protein
MIGCQPLVLLAGILAAAIKVMEQRAGLAELVQCCVEHFHESALAETAGMIYPFDIPGVPSSF